MRNLKFKIALFAMLAMVLAALNYFSPSIVLVSKAGAQTGTHYSTSSTKQKYDRITTTFSLDCVTTGSTTSGVSGSASGGG